MNKEWYKSKTIWACVVTAAAFMLSLAGKTHGNAGLIHAGQNLTANQDVVAETLQSGAIEIAGVIASIIGVIGRCIASGPLVGGDFVKSTSMESSGLTMGYPPLTAPKAGTALILLLCLGLMFSGGCSSSQVQQAAKLNSTLTNGLEQAATTMDSITADMNDVGNMESKLLAADPNLEKAAKHFASSYDNLKAKAKQVAQ